MVNETLIILPVALNRQCYLLAHSSTLMVIGHRYLIITHEGFPPMKPVREYRSSCFGKGVLLLGSV